MSFSSQVKTEWLEDGRSMRLLDSLAFEDKHGLQWVAPIGSVVDGASIPRFFWRFIGGPFSGKYRDASVIHDVYCVLQDRPSPEVHAMFYEAMRARGVWRTKAFLMWMAVRVFGPRFRGLDLQR